MTIYNSLKCFLYTETSHTGIQNPDSKTVFVTSSFYPSQMSREYSLRAVKPALSLAGELTKPPENSSEETLNNVWKLFILLYHSYHSFMFSVMVKTLYLLKVLKGHCHSFTLLPRNISFSAFFFPTTFRSYHMSVFILPFPKV